MVSLKSDMGDIEEIKIRIVIIFLFAIFARGGIKDLSII